MKRVQVYKWGEGSVAERDRRTGVVLVTTKTVRIPTYKGKLHGFGTDWEELNHGIGQFPVAIVEKDDGNLVAEPITLVRILDGEY